jgi:hypothetical protein
MRKPNRFGQAKIQGKYRNLAFLSGAEAEENMVFFYINIS